MATKETIYKVREILDVDFGDFDVYDNVCEELGIAFCPPVYLTEEGEKEFADVLEYTIKIYTHTDNHPYESTIGVVIIDDEDTKGKDYWEHKLARAKKFFYAMAGYCSCEEYDKWIKEE